jgi:threonine/homoserine/homoserine lactone efflux protein
MISLEFLITSLVVVLIPGTGVIYTVSTGIVQGRRASVYAALGCTAGIVPHLMATVLGLAAVMHASAVAFQVLKYAGVAYLFYVAYATWRDKSAFAVDASMSKTSATGLVVKAFLLNILNPKLTIFFLAFLPQFVEPGTDQPLLQLLLLSAVFMAGCRFHSRAKLAALWFYCGLCRARGEACAYRKVTPNLARQTSNAQTNFITLRNLICPHH